MNVLMLVLLIAAALSFGLWLGIHESRMPDYDDPNLYGDGTFDQINRDRRA